MTNERKALELSSISKYDFTIEESNAAYNAAIEAMKWKEKQMIEKAIEWLRENIYNRVYECGDRLGFPTADFLADFKKAMEE